MHMDVEDVKASSFKARIVLSSGAHDHILSRHRCASVQGKCVVQPLRTIVWNPRCKTKARSHVGIIGDDLDAIPV